MRRELPPFSCLEIGGGGAMLAKGLFVGRLRVGKCIYMPQEQPKERWNDSKQAALERLYLRDGRGKKTHPLHGSYHGLTAKFWGWS